MEILIGRIKEGNRGLYRITYNNGYIYVGSFVNSKDILLENLILVHLE